MQELSSAEARVMRGIESRYHRKAIEERAVAKAEHQAQALAIAPGNAGWSTKAPKVSPGAKERAKVAERHAAQAQRDWARRHPQLAAAERALRVERAASVKRFGHKLHGTIETHAKAARIGQGPLQRLLQSGAIDDDQCAWGEQIAAAYELITAEVRVRTCSGETRVDVQRRGDGTFHEAIGRVWLEMAYSAWRDGLGVDAAAVLDMIVGDAAGFTVIAKRHGMHNRRAKKLLIDALNAWPGKLRHYCKMIDDEVLAEAHAALA